MKFILVSLLSLMSVIATPPKISCAEKVADPGSIVMHWTNNNGIPLRSFSQLFVFNPKLTWAMNGGMYTERYEPVGYYVENGRKLRSIKLVKSDYYNFGKKPQSVFLITKDNKAKVVTVQDPILHSGNIKYATQSAPMLVIDGQINPKLTHSSSTAIRNGVGILANNKVLFAVSNDWVTFQQFAQYFKDKGCVNAMFLDGNISKAVNKQEGLFAYDQYGPFIGVTQ